MKLFNPCQRIYYEGTALEIVYVLNFHHEPFLEYVKRKLTQFGVTASFDSDVPYEVVANYLLEVMCAAKVLCHAPDDDQALVN